MIKKIFKNKLVDYILIVYAIGLIVGIYLATKNKLSITINSQHEITFLAVVKTFCINYWYLFVIWLCAKVPFGIIIDSIIIFFRGLIFGLAILVIKNDLQLFFLLLFLEIVMILPSLTLLCFCSLLLSLSKIIPMPNTKINKNNYQMIMIGIIVVMILYSIIVNIY